MDRQNPNNSPLLLSSLLLTNFRCFRRLQISFDARMTVLVANNGQGKTAVLDAAAIAFGPFVGAFDNAKDRGFLESDMRTIYSGSPASMEIAADGTRLEAEGYVQYETAWSGNKDPNWISWSRALAGLKARTTRNGAKILTAYGKRLQHDTRAAADHPVTSMLRPTGQVLPLVAYYDTGRLWKVRREPYRKLPMTSRMVGYTNCLESGSDFKLFASFFEYWCRGRSENRIAAWEAGLAPSESGFDHAIQAVNSAVEKCLETTGWSNLDYSYDYLEVVASHPIHGTHPVSRLSDGIRSMLALVADIAFRMVKLNPNLGPFAASQTPGIVLIDEVDMHLHPSWQQTVLDSLAKAFPRIQFIVSTHSPQVLTTVPAYCIRVLDEGEVYSAPPGTEGADSSRLLKRVFGVDPRPQDNRATKELQRYLDLVDRNEWASKEALELRKRLDDRYQGEEQALLDADLLIDNRKWELEHEH